MSGKGNAQTAQKPLEWAGEFGGSPEPRWPKNDAIQGRPDEKESRSIDREEFRQRAAAFRARLAAGDQEAVQRASRVAAEVLGSAELERELYAMTDEQLADVLLKQVWGKINIFSKEDGIIGCAIERLRRAKGGPLPWEDDGEEA